MLTLATTLRRIAPRLTCPRCGRAWRALRRTVDAPYTRRWRGCPTCGPTSGFEIS